MGYRRVAVTTADNNSMNLKAIKNIDKRIVTLALCTSGISQETAEIIRDHADLAWGCGSKHVRNIVGSHAWVQLGTRLPVFILSEKGFNLTKPRIKHEFSLSTEKLNLDSNKKYHNLKVVNELPVRSKDEPYPLI